MRRISLRSALPPEAFRRQLELAVRERNLQKQGGARTKAAWRGDRLLLKRTEYACQEQRGLQRTGRGATWRVGTAHRWCFANPFRGRLLPDRQGGSVLEGRIVLHAGGIVIFALTAIIIVLILCFSHTIEDYLFTAAAAALLLYHALPAFGRPEDTPASGRLLEFLQEAFVMERQDT